MLGHEIHRDAIVGPCIVLSLKHARMSRGARLGPFNVIRSVALVELREDADIGSFNWISAHPMYQGLFPGAGTFAMRSQAAVTSRHYIDCSGTVELGHFCVLAGHRTTILTHEASLSAPIQQVGKVTVGARSAVFTNSVLLMGTRVPPGSIVAAHATVTGDSTRKGEPGLYAGTPARRIADVPCGPGTALGRDTRDISAAEVTEPLGISDAPELNRLEDHATRPVRNQT